MNKTAILVLFALVAIMVQKPEDSTAIADETVMVEEVMVVEVEVPKTLTDREKMEHSAHKYAEVYGVDVHSLIRTSLNENDTSEACRQSGLTYKEGNRWGKPAGSREESYGVAQIHLPDHPNVTKEQACDIDFSIGFMAEHFAKGQQSKWMGYRG